MPLPPENPVHTPQQNDDSLVDRWLDWLEKALDYKRLLLRSMLAASALALGLGLLWPKSYSATTVILPPQQNQGMMGMMLGQLSGGMVALAGDLLGKGSDSDRYVGLLTCNAVADPIIDRFRLMEVYRCDYRTDAYRALESRTRVEAGKKDGVISITVEDREPERAAHLANAYVEELKKLTVRLKSTGAGNSYAFFAERLAKAQGDLAQAEESLKAFQARNKVVLVPEQAEAAIAGIAQMKAQLVAQEVQLATSLRLFTEASQEVKNARSALAGLKSQLAQLEQGGSGDAIPGLGSMPGLGQQYLRLMREFKIQEALVDVLTRHCEMTQFSQGNDVSGVQVIQPARVPDRKVKPSLPLLAVGGAVAGAVLALLYSLLLHLLRQPARDRTL